MEGVCSDDTGDCGEYGAGHDRVVAGKVEARVVYDAGRNVWW